MLRRAVRGAGPVAPLAVLAALALGACTDGGANPSSATGGTPSGEPSPPATAPPLRQAGPLESYLGFTGGLDSPEALVARVAWRESLTAACMTALGFEYTPLVPRPEEIRVPDGPAPGSQEYVEAYGYGIWGPPADGGTSWEITTDPNVERAETMSEAGREAYETALWGPVTSEGDDGSVGREGGCVSAAETPAGADAAFLVGVRQEALAFLDAIGEDPRFADVDAAWASCMLDAGFEERSPLAAQRRVVEDMAALAAGGVLLDAALLGEKAAEERRLAVADLDCQEATGWAARHREIELEVQQEYVDAHRADLEALVAALATPE